MLNVNIMHLNVVVIATRMLTSWKLFYCLSFGLKCLYKNDDFFTLVFDEILIRKTIFFMYGLFNISFR